MSELTKMFRDCLRNTLKTKPKFNAENSSTDQVAISSMQHMLQICEGAEVATYLKL